MNQDSNKVFNNSEYDYRDSYIKIYDDENKIKILLEDDNEIKETVLDTLLRQYLPTKRYLKY